MTDDIRLITRAAAFAAQAHAGQMRKYLLEAYIVHPLLVGQFAAQLGYPATMIAAGYLHDVVEDTEISLNDLKIAFPDYPDVVSLVDAVTKTWSSKDKLSDAAIKAETIRYYDKVVRIMGAPVLKSLDRVANLRDILTGFTGREQDAAYRKWAMNYFTKTAEQFPRILSAIDYQARLSSWATPDAPDLIRQMYEGTMLDLQDKLVSL